MRACKWASLRLDSHLSEIEDKLLQAHLARCLDCRALADGMTAATLTLRARPLEEPAFAFQAPRRRGARALRLRAATAAAAAAAVVGLSGLVSFELATGRAPSASVANPKLIGLKEEQMDELDSAGRRPREVPRGLTAARQMTVASGSTVAPPRPAEVSTRLLDR